MKISGCNRAGGFGHFGAKSLGFSHEPWAGVCTQHHSHSTTVENHWDRGTTTVRSGLLPGHARPCMCQFYCSRPRRGPPPFPDNPHSTMPEASAPWRITPSRCFFTLHKDRCPQHGLLERQARLRHIPRPLGHHPASPKASAAQIISRIIRNRHRL